MIINKINGSSFVTYKRKNYNNLKKEINQNSLNLSKETQQNNFSQMLQKYVKKLSDIVIKILDTF